MAEDEGELDELEPARRLAANLLEARSLSPPVPVEDLVEERFELHADYFPADCDAVVVGLAESGARPRLYLNKDRSPVRQRFTLAHELAHLVISWHLGTIVCHTDLREEEVDDPYDETAMEAADILWAIEREANAFASELLLPTRWLRGLFSTGPVPSALASMEDAEVSAAAACFTSLGLLPTGHILAVFDRYDAARYLFRTEGTDVPLPPRRQLHELDPSILDATADETAAIPFGTQTIRWWRFDQRKELIKTEDGRTAREILDDILRDTWPPDDIVRVRQSINGIVGSAKNSATDLTASGLHAHLLSRFAYRPDLRQVEQHPHFGLFVSRKADEISE